MKLSQILQNDMTHFEQYNQIIDFRKSNPLPKDQYGENHHIVPKSICHILKDSSENIVRLSAQEHFLAHYHLWLAYHDELHEKNWAKKMCFAFIRMKQQLMKCDDIESMAKLYEEVKIEFSKNMSEVRKGKQHSENTKMRIAKTLQGHIVSEQSRNKNRQSHLGKKYPNRKHVSDEVRQQLALRMKGRCLSQKTKDKISETLKGHRGYTTGKKWFNDGLQSIMAFECPEGFNAGRLYKRRSK